MTAAGLWLFATATAVLVVLMLVLESLVRRRAWRHETTRRIAHVLACLYGVASHAWLPLWLFVLACAVFFGLLVVSRRMRLLTAVHVTRRDSLGEVYLPLGIIIGALAGALAHSHAVFVASVLVLAFADVAAGVTGDLLRSPRKTSWGSLAFFVVAAAVVLACGFDPALALVTAALATAAERLASRGTDNLAVPLVTGLALALLPV